MARTTAMRLIELMIFRQDIHRVLKYLGEMGDFQFQQDFSVSSDTKAANPNQEIFDGLQQTRTNLGLEDLDGLKGTLCLPAGRQSVPFNPSRSSRPRFVLVC